MATFQLFHVSDLHCGDKSDLANIKTFIDFCRRNPGSTGRVIGSVRFGAHQTTYDLEVAKKAARFIVVNSTETSLIVVSGDLAASGNADDLAIARDFVEGQPRNRQMFFTTGRATPTIAAAELPVFLIPGNHDRYQDVWGTPGGMEFDRIFYSHWPTPPDKVRRRVLEDEASGSKLGLVGADFCLWTEADATHPRKMNRFGQGKAYTQIVSAIKAETRALRASYDDIGIAWVIHFPPCAVDEEDDPSLELLERASVLDAARDENIRLILAGHIHKPKLVQTGEISVFCAGTAAAYLCEDGYWIHKLDIEVAASTAVLKNRTNYAWDGSDFVQTRI